jgi:hypothetical protein
VPVVLAVLGIRSFYALLAPWERVLPSENRLQMRWRRLAWKQEPLQRQLGDVARDLELTELLLDSQQQRSDGKRIDGPTAVPRD